MVFYFGKNFLEKRVNHPTDIFGLIVSRHRYYYIHMYASLRSSLRFGSKVGIAMTIFIYYNCIMIFDIITLFPQMFSGPFDQSILRRAQDKLLVSFNLHNLRDYAIDERGSVDDRPYGGGTGMLLRIEPIFKALNKVKTQNSKGKISSQKSKVVLLDARGGKFTQKIAREYSRLNQLILICGHYEGVDERVRKHLVDETISIGDYVLTGGEIPAMVIIDAVTRLLPGVLEKSEATEIESFSSPNNLEFPQYTRPEEFNGWKVPKVLLSGNHAEIKKWRETKVLPRTP